MKNRKLVQWMTAIPLVALALLACDRLTEIDDFEGDGGTDTDSDTDTESEYPEYPADAVDVLIIVDNSGSMREEQDLLATHAFTVLGALTDPLPSWGLQPIDDIRVAVVSSDMGIQWGGHPYDEDDFEDGEGWPGSVPEGCWSPGDWGEFQVYPEGKTVDIESGVIPCGESGTQCPGGWECGDLVDGVGTCQAPGGDGTGWECPDLGLAWAETPIESTPNPDLAGQVACLTNLGTSGCGFEQQLQAGAIALEREDQSDFVRDGALLVVVVVTDEEDCSIESKDFFGVDEVQNLADGRVNISCGNHPEYLYDPAHFKQRFAAVKGGNPNGVLFAAVIGVPVDEACQGRGDQIGGCLDHPDMELEVVLENAAYFFKPACERYDGDQQLTKARPGRRFVELAQDFGENGYVFSICNEDWSPAMRGIAEIISNELTD